jgi:hypothetical protein
MSTEVIDDILVNDDDGQKIKTNEITGKRYQFHSLPKEFQDWHNLYYILEKQGEVDRNIVAEANLNAYFWMSLFDATKYALFLSGFAIFAILKWVVTNSILGLIFALLTFTPILIFVGYHFIFYMLIKAQVVGPVTKKLAKNTADTFLNVFFAVYFSILIGFVFVFYFLDSLMPLFFHFIANLYKYVYIHDYFNSIQGIILKYLIEFHNGLVYLINTKNLLKNIYLYSLIIFLISILIIGYIAAKAYYKHRKNILMEVKREQLKQGYPIEIAQSIITEWRKKHF